MGRAIVFYKSGSFDGLVREITKRDWKYYCSSLKPLHSGLLFFYPERYEIVLPTFANNYINVYFSKETVVELPSNYLARRLLFPKRKVPANMWLDTCLCETQLKTKTFG